MKNKLGLSYVIFEDTIDHLEWSIKTIRHLTDYISCVYQKTSYQGNTQTTDYSSYLNELLSKNYIDNIIYTEPDSSLSPRKNELKNRNLGLQDAKEKDCTHFLTIDGDEYYIPEEFEKIKNKMIHEEYESSACQMITYYKYLNLILDPPEEYYCPFIYKIKPNLFFNDSTFFPVGVDSNRIYHSDNFLLLKRDDLQMHHMSSVRKDLSIKLRNHSCRGQFDSGIDTIVNHHRHYKYPDKILFQAQPYSWYDCKLIKPLFENPNFESI